MWRSISVVLTVFFATSPFCYIFHHGLCLADTPVLEANKKVYWKHLAPGMDIGWIVAKTQSIVGDNKIVVLRMEPKFWKLEAVGISQTNESEGHTARQWCKRQKFAAAINAGMFETDYRTHTGYFRIGKHVNNGRVNKYKSVAAFGRKNKSSPMFRIFDLDEAHTSIDVISKDYSSVVQNLRLIKRTGQNRWSQQQKMWSEAALGEDSEGRILFVFSRSPFSMHDFSKELISSGIGVVSLQHLEGGPEAQLYLKVKGTEMELFGSYETSFREDDTNKKAWKIPNVFGVRPR